MATKHLQCLYRPYWPHNMAFFSMTHYGSTWSKRGSARPPKIGSCTTSCYVDPIASSWGIAQIRAIMETPDRLLHPSRYSVSI